MKKALSLFALTLSAIVLVACGSSGSSTSSTSSVPSSFINTNYCRGGGGGGGGGQTLKLSADPSGAPKYNTKCLTAKPGKVTIEFSNPSATPQDVAVKDPEGKLYGVSSKGAGPTRKGDKTPLNLNLPSGRYIYYSTVPGDEAAGMLGTLLVK